MEGLDCPGFKEMLVAYLPQSEILQVNIFLHCFKPPTISVVGRSKFVSRNLEISVSELQRYRNVSAQLKVM